MPQHSSLSKRTSLLWNTQIINLWWTQRFSVLRDNEDNSRCHCGVFYGNHRGLLFFHCSCKRWHVSMDHSVRSLTERWVEVPVVNRISWEVQCHYCCFLLLAFLLHPFSASFSPPPPSLRVYTLCRSVWICVFMDLVRLLFVIPVWYTTALS